MAGHPNDAEKILDEVRKARPNSAEANHFLGRALLARGENLAEPRRYLEMAVTSDSTRPESYLYGGWAANELGQPAKGPLAPRSTRPSISITTSPTPTGSAASSSRSRAPRKTPSTTCKPRLEKRLLPLRSLGDHRPLRPRTCKSAARGRGKPGAAPIAGNDDHAEWHSPPRQGPRRPRQPRAAVAPELEKAVDLASRPDQPSYPWLYDAHFLLADALPHTPANKPKVIEHYQRFLDLAPAGNAYRAEAEKALLGMGIRQNR